MTPVDRSSAPTANIGQARAGRRGKSRHSRTALSGGRIPSRAIASPEWRRIFEIVRVSYLLANAKAVVLECDADTEIEEDIRRVVVLAPRDELVERCCEPVGDEARRRKLESEGFRVTSARDACAYVQATLEQTEGVLHGPP